MTARDTEYLPAWVEILPGVFCFPDSCNVYAVVGADGTLIVDAGTGAWLDHLDELPKPPVALACTHYFRDHAAGAARAAERGIPVYVPEGEREIFEDPALHFLRRESYIVYTNTWDHFAPIEPIEVTGTLDDHAVIRLAGFDVEVVPLPGVTPTQSGLAVLVEGRRVVFCGEAIHSPGRLARVAPLQYGYGDMPGAVAAVSSARELRRRQPHALLPSLGSPMLDEVDAALSALEENLAGHARNRSDEASLWELLDREPFARVSESVWRTTNAIAVATFIVSSTGRVLVIDLGYDTVFGSWSDNAAAPHRRRPSLRLARAFCELVGADRVDVALVTHYHDDHVASIPLLQRVYGTECWCPAWFADILEHPEAYAFPCTWPRPSRIDRAIGAGDIATWEGIDFTFVPMSGHTRFSAAIGFEIDGLRFAHTGDQYHSRDAQLQSSFPVPSDYRMNWATDEFAPGLVYRNGAFLDSYAKSAEWLHDWRPDVVLSGHQPAMRVDENFHRRLDERAEHHVDVHRRSMALADDEAHFGVDSWGGWITPYRTHLPSPGEVTVRATVRNPLPRQATLKVELAGPPGWRGTSATLDAGPREEVACDLSIDVPTPCRRHPIAIELWANGQPFGQVAEALVTVGGPAF